DDERRGERRSVPGGPRGASRGGAPRERAPGGGALVTIPQGCRGEGPAAQLAQARAFLLKAVSRLPVERWNERPSAAYSPVGCHLGHVAAMQARWLLPGDRASGRFGQFFDPTQTAKHSRAVLPAPDQLRAWLA